MSIPEMYDTLMTDYSNEIGAVGLGDPWLLGIRAVGRLATNGCQARRRLYLGVPRAEVRLVRVKKQVISWARPRRFDRLVVVKDVWVEVYALWPCDRPDLRIHPHQSEDLSSSAVSSNAGPQWKGRELGRRHVRTPWMHHSAM